MKKNNFVRIITFKREELTGLVSLGKPLQDGEVYRRSCELDELVVKYMSNQICNRKKGK